MRQPSLAAVAAFTDSVIGKAYELGEEGPGAYDCWSLFRLAQRELFGRETPRVVLPKGTSLDGIASALASHPGRALWRPVPGPVHGGGVELMSVRTPLHVGLWLEVDRGQLLHCAAPAGVQLNTLPELRALGWRILGFHDWAASDA